MSVFARLVRPLAFAALALAPLAARADIPPEGAAECRGKGGGAACELHGAAGHCKETTCSRARKDGNSEYACTLCEPDPADAKPAASASGKSSCAGGPDAGLAGLAAALGLVVLRRAGRARA